MNKILEQYKNSNRYRKLWYVFILLLNMCIIGGAIPSSYIERYSYNEDTGGEFFNVGNLVWEEWKGGNLFTTFIEINRENGWITLYDKSRSMYLKFPTNGGTAYWKLVDDSSWTEWVYLTNTYVEQKFKVEPTVRIRPINDEIKKGQDGLVELYLDNPGLNSVSLTVEILINTPSWVSVHGEGFGEAAIGTVSGKFEVAPGNSRTININFRTENTLDFSAQFTGTYYPGNNKDVYQPISLTVPFRVIVPTPTPNHDIITYYRTLGQYLDIVETNDLLKAADDWGDNFVPQGFSISITTDQLLTLADEWRNT